MTMEFAATTTGRAQRRVGRRQRRLKRLRARGGELAGCFCNAAGEGEAQLGGEQLLDVRPADVCRFLHFLHAEDLRVGRH